MDAFEILAEQYRPMLVAYLRSLVHDESAAEDLTQETLLAAFQSLGTFQKGGAFGAWLRGIARNKALMSHRASARHRTVIADSRIIEGMEEVYTTLDRSHPTAEAWPDRLEFLHGCIHSLQDKLRATVQAVYLQNRPLEELAQAENTSYDAIAQRLSRARNLLRDCLQRKISGTAAR